MTLNLVELWDFYSHFEESQGPDDQSPEDHQNHRDPSEPTEMPLRVRAPHQVETDNLEKPGRFGLASVLLISQMHPARGVLQIALGDSYAISRMCRTCMQAGPAGE